MNHYRSKINTEFKRNLKDGIVFDTVPSFEPYVDYAFCGEKQGLGFKTIREMERDGMLASYKQLCHTLEIDYDKAVMTNIVHGDDVFIVCNNQAGFGISNEKNLSPCDGLITGEIGLPICTTHADCTPIAFYDKVKNVGSVVHAGWRGVLLKIHINTIEKMKTLFGSKPENILVAIGPFINQCCFEVDHDVSEKFENEFEYDDFIIKGEIKDRIDLGKIILCGLEHEGIPPENVTMDQRCTCCEENNLHSFRRDQGKSGTMVQIMRLRKRC